MPSRPDHPAALDDDFFVSPELRASLLRFVQSRVRDPHWAEDLTQEILLKALTHYTGIRDQKRRQAWLFQIARNVISDHFRGAKGREVFSDKHDPEDALLPIEDGPTTSYFPEILSSFLRGVVDELPPIYRDALYFTDCQGHSQVELARNEGISVSGAKSRVQRARAAVRDAVERCCLLETDRYGGVVEVEPRPDYCG